MSKTEASTPAAGGPAALTFDQFAGQQPVQIQVERDDRGRPFPITAVLVHGRVQTGVNTTRVTDGVAIDCYFVGIGNAKRGRHLVLSENLWLQGTQKDGKARGVAVDRVKLFGGKSLFGTVDGTIEGELLMDDTFDAWLADFIAAGKATVVKLVIEDDPKAAGRDLFRIRHVNKHDSPKAQGLLERDDVKEWIKMGHEKALERVKARDAGMAGGEDLDFDDEDLDF